MCPIRSRHAAIGLIALLLQLHTALLFALPCGSCADAFSAQVAPEQMPPGCHQSAADAVPPGDAADSEHGCPRCVLGHCVGNLTMVLPGLVASIDPAVPGLFASLPGPVVICGDIQPPFRPPII